MILSDTYVRTTRFKRAQLCSWSVKQKRERRFCQYKLAVVLAEKGEGEKKRHSYG